TYTHTSRLYFVLLLLVLSSERCWSAANLSVECLIINLEYVECTWPETSRMNYTFSIAFKDDALYEDCTEYMLVNNYTVGCRIPLKNHEEKFDKVYTKISTGGNQSVSQAFESLSKYVRLNPPYNLSVVWFEQNSTLVLQWKKSTNIGNKCMVYMVDQQTDTNQYFNVTESSCSLPLVSQNKQYAFRVRSTLSDNCRPSDLWSNWSTWVKWGNGGTKTNKNISRSGWWQGLFAILPVTLLFLLVWLLFYCERVKIILLPIVPDPSKNLQDLFHKHDGNVESWIHISKELKEAFEPDYTEPACDVCEVSPSCDVSATPEATPTSQADTCDKTNTEEQPKVQPEKQLSSLATMASV
ncbi:putative cytokine receptor common subunit gamma, partial [Triplophysa rosa]